MFQNSELSIDTPVSSRHIQVMAAAVLGVCILAITVFAPLDVIHNATHDTRHSAGFPCH